MLAQMPVLGGEQKVRDLLVGEIERWRPTHGVVLQDGTMVFCRLLVDGEKLVGLECDTGAGTEVLRVTAVDVALEREIVYPDIELLPEDCRFLLEFPGFRYHYLPPYLFVADTPYIQVHMAYETLIELSGELVETFGPVMTREQSGKLAYVCVFRDRETYVRNSPRNEEVALGRSAGFYDRKLDALIVHGGQGNTQDTEGDGADTGGKPDPDPAPEVLAASTRRTLRHEGAHQFAHAYGIHSGEGFEHLWLLEGLAQFCESTPVGQSDPAQLQLLREAYAARELIPWQDLVDNAAGEGFGAQYDRPDLAYAQCWFLFRQLMAKSHRPQLYWYIERVRGLGPEELGKPRSKLLSECLQCPFLQLERELNDAIGVGAPGTADTDGHGRTRTESD